MAAPIVSMREVTRRFGPVLANDSVSLEVRAGEVHALVGENGAGKSTLMKVLYGLHPPHAGTIEVDGRAVRIDTPAAAMKLGLGMVHQHFLLVDTLTVAENVVLGREPGGFFSTLSPLDAEHAVVELSRNYHLPVDPNARVAGLSVGGQQRVEILKVLYRGARVLILDEPTAVLTPQEVDELFGVLRDLRDHGTAIVLITHKLNEVKALADQVTVMRGGRVVGSGPAAEMSIEQMAELMVGRVPPPLEARVERKPGGRVLEAMNLHVLDDRKLPAVRGVSFDVRGFEIVGVAGVEGNGQHELVECLAGLRPPSAGRVRIGGIEVTRDGARVHTEAGLSHIPADRLKRGLVAELSVAENLVLGRQREAAHGCARRAGAEARWRRSTSPTCARPIRARAGRLGRQPAEARRGPRAGPDRARADRRTPHARRRPGRDRRDPPPHPGCARRGARRAARLERAIRDPRALRPHRGAQRRPDRARDAPRRDHRAHARPAHDGAPRSSTRRSSLPPTTGNRARERAETRRRPAHRAGAGRGGAAGADRRRRADRRGGQSPFEVYALPAQALGTGYGTARRCSRAAAVRRAVGGAGVPRRAVQRRRKARCAGRLRRRAAGAYVPLPRRGCCLPVALLAAALAARCGPDRGVLEARFGAHEVINTIMLNSSRSRWWRSGGATCS
jgi:simple sugar transport system ATP-binding protein